MSHTSYHNQQEPLNKNPLNHSEFAKNGKTEKTEKKPKKPKKTEKKTRKNRTLPQISNLGLVFFGFFWVATPQFRSFIHTN